MMTIIKSDNKKFEFLKDFFKVLRSETIYYRPKVEFYKIKKKKTIYFLSEYVICYNKMFNDKEKIDLLKYSKGLKYLNGYKQNQNEIEEFVNMCKKMKI